MVLTAHEAVRQAFDGQRPWSDVFTVDESGNEALNLLRNQGYFTGEKKALAAQDPGDMKAVLESLTLQRVFELYCDPIVVEGMDTGNWDPMLGRAAKARVEHICKLPTFMLAAYSLFEELASENYNSARHQTQLLATMVEHTAWPLDLQGLALALLETQHHSHSYETVLGGFRGFANVLSLLQQ